MESSLFHRHDFGRLSAAETMLTKVIEPAADCRSADRAIRHQRHRPVSRLFVG
jgi:hypothetical protein